MHVCDIDEQALAALPEGITYTHADVSQETDVDRLFQDAAPLGGLDVVVNNAGIAGPTASIEDIDPESWNRTININLNGQYRVASRATPLLRESQGLLINMASVAGRLGFAYRTPYAASKWAIVGFTKSLACELGPEGVRVNAILPGIVRGPRMRKSSPTALLNVASAMPRWSRRTSPKSLCGAWLNLLTLLRWRCFCPPLAAPTSRAKR